VSGKQLLRVKDLAKVVEEKGKKLVIFHDVSFDVEEGEIVSLVGPTGSGKSSVLKMVIGLEKPTKGEILYRGEPLDREKHYIALVPQQPVAFPWLTVQENIEVVLEALGLPLRQRLRRALKYIDMLGLDSFEDTYPRELTIAMRQRLSIARALAVETELLAMDDPFTALDPLSSEELREEFLRLWLDGMLPVRSVLLVTTNVEEALYLSRRVYVLSGRPGRLLDVIDVDLPYPRDRETERFVELMDRVYTAILMG